MAAPKGECIFCGPAPYNTARAHGSDFPEQLEAYLTSDNVHFRLQNERDLCDVLRLPVHYANLIHWSDPDDPLKIALPPTESDVQSYELGDPIATS